MAFNLQKVLRALLFSSSQPLSIKDVQDLFARFHAQAPATAESEEEIQPAPVEASQTEAGAADENGAPASETKTDPVDSEAPSLMPLELRENHVADQGNASMDAGVSRSEAEAPAVPEIAAEMPVEEAADADLYQDVPTLITAAQIREAIDAIATDMRATSDIYILVEGPAGYRVMTHPRYARWIRIMRDEPPPVRLSQSALETLAVVAYRQPVTRSEIESIRGVSAEAGLSKLLERELIRITGRAELPGRPHQYSTTEKFMEFVGVKSLVELPASDVLTPRQIDAWLQSATKITPPSDADMGLPLEEGEGITPNLEKVEITHTTPPFVTQAPAETGGASEASNQAGGHELPAPTQSEQSEQSEQSQSSGQTSSSESSENLQQ